MRTRGAALAHVKNAPVYVIFGSPVNFSHTCANHKLIAMFEARWQRENHRLMTWSAPALQPISRPPQHPVRDRETLHHLPHNQQRGQTKAAAAA